MVAIQQKIKSILQFKSSPASQDIAGRELKRSGRTRRAATSSAASSGATKTEWTPARRVYLTGTV